jgi:hypothetical protein
MEVATDPPQGITARKEKKESVLPIIDALYQSIPIVEAYKDMFRTEMMKQTLADFYLYAVDLLWKLATYSQHIYSMFSHILTRWYSIILINLE